MNYNEERNKRRVRKLVRIFAKCTNFYKQKKELKKGGVEEEMKSFD